MANRGNSNRKYKHTWPHIYEAHDVAGKGGLRYNMRVRNVDGVGGKNAGTTRV